MTVPFFSPSDIYPCRRGRGLSALLTRPGSGRLLLAVAWVLLGLMLSLVMALAARAQGSGTLEGQVVNGTAGAAEVGAGLSVKLYMLQGVTETASLETKTDAGGHFRFDGLDTDPNLKYRPEVVYLDVPYTSPEPLQFAGDETELAATITVYETTDDDSVLRIDSVHIIAESFGQVLRLTEIHLFGNSGDRTYVGSGTGGQPATLFIPLPEGAVGVAFGAGISEERFVEVEGGLMDTEPVLPGAETALVFFSYHLVVDGDTIAVERAFAYPATVLNILAAQPGLAINSEQLQSGGTELFQGREYELYSAHDLVPDTPLLLEFVLSAEPASSTGTEGMPPASSEAVAGVPTQGNQKLLLWLGLALAAVAVIGGAVYPMVSKRPASPPEMALDLSSNAKARRLVAELADLEEAFEARQIDEEAYERQRAAIYEALKSL